MEADSSFDPLHIFFNLSTCVREQGIKKMEITSIYDVLTGCHSHPRCSIQSPTTQTELDCGFFGFLYHCSFIPLNNEEILLV